MLKAVKELSETFEKEFPGNITMTLRRLQPWSWNAVALRAGKAATALREGRAALERYGFEGEEFDELADPASWDGIAEYIGAVELGIEAIDSWSGNGICREGEETPAPIEFATVARLFRIEQIRKDFLATMDRDGHRTVMAAEGNV